MILMEKRELFDLIRLVAALSVAVRVWRMVMLVRFFFCPTAGADFDHYHSLTHHLA
jgi:hypothetical protein